MVGLFPTVRDKPVGMSEPDESDSIDALCSELADLIEERPTVAVAESLTGGGIASALSRASTSGDWFAGGIVAYQPHVKHDLLEVPPGPIVSAQAAETMASNTARLLGADLVVAVTGEAGPEPQEDKEPGTVWFGVFDHGSVDATKRVFDGDPPDVLAATVAASVRILVDRAKSSGG